VAVTGGFPTALPIMPGWNYTVRLYRPRPEILNRQGFMHQKVMLVDDRFATHRDSEFR
jgi:hypothetical protein